MRRRSERGDALIESLIAILLTFTVATGLAYAMGRVMQIQRYQITQHAVLDELARQLSVTGARGLCSGSVGLTINVGASLPSITTDAPTCARAEVTVTPTLTNSLLTKTISADRVYTSIMINTPTNTLVSGDSVLSVKL